MYEISDINQVTDPQSVLDFWNGMQRNLPPYLYAGMLTPTPTPYNTFRHYWGKAQVPQGLNMSTSSTKANFTNAKGAFAFDTYHTIGFKKGHQMSAHYMALIRRALRNNVNNQGFIQSLAKLVYNDQTLLVEDAMFNREILFEQELNTGFITSNDNGLSTTPMNFHMPANHKLGVDVQWGNKSSHAIENLNDAKRYIADDNNTNETLAIMNDHTFLKLCKSGDVINGANHLQMDIDNIPTDFTQERQFVVHDTGLTIMIYDKGIHGDRFIPDDKVILVPQKVIGRLMYSPTDEQLDIPGREDARVATNNAGVTLTSYGSINPPSNKMIASQNICPIIDKMPQILSINVGQNVNATGSHYSVNPLPSNDSGSTPSGSNNSASNNAPKSSTTKGK